MFPSSLLDVNIASHPSSLDLEEILEEGSPEREETLEDQLTRLLLKEETAFSSPGMVQFRQFPSILHAHTEDGTPFERLKLMHPPLSRSTSPQVSNLADSLHSTIMKRLSENENINPSFSGVDSFHLHQMLHDVLSENLSQVNQSLSEQLRDDILTLLDADLSHLSTSEASIQSLQGSIRNSLYRALSEDSFMSFIPKSQSSATKSQKSSSKVSKTIKSDEKGDAFQEKLRNLSAHWEIGFVKKQLDRLCKANSGESGQHRMFESKVNERFRDEYNLEYAEMTFLEKAPKNFIIFNKPGIDTSILVDKIHEMYGAVILDPKTLLNRELSRPNKTEESLSHQLRKGKCINSETIFRLIMKQINDSNEVKNSGYVLSGLPMFRFSDGNQDALNVRKQLEELFAVQNKPNIIIYLYCPNPCLIRLRSLTNMDSNTGYEHNLGISRLVKMYEILESENSPESKTYENAEKFSQEGEDEEIGEGEEEFMNGIKDDGTNEVVTRDTNPKFHNFPDNLMMGFILEDFKDDSKKLSSAFKSIRAQNLVTNVGLQTIKQYRDIVLPIIDEYVLSHDPQYYIRLDGRLPSNQNFKIIHQWLSRLCVSKPCGAQTLALKDNSNEESEGRSLEEEEENVEEKLDRGEPIGSSLLKRALSLSCISSFRWKLSEFGTKCPVSLFYGTCEIGIPKFTVTYLDKVYFFKSHDNLAVFLENPKKFIKVPNPKPTFKLIICGFTGCDIPALSQKLCEKFYLRYVDFNSLLENYIEIKRKKMIEDFKKHATKKISESKAFGVLKEKMLKRIILSWKNHVLSRIKTILNMDISLIGEAELGDELDSVPVILSDQRFSKSSDSIQNILNNLELCEQIIQNFNLINNYVPDDLEDLVNKDCQQKIEDIAETAVLEDFDSNVSLEDVRDAILMIDDLDSLESETLNFVNATLPPYRGWVLVGLPININLWTVLKDSKVFTNDLVFVYNANETPYGENIDSANELKSKRVKNSSISDLLSSLKNKNKKGNNFNSERLALASIQEIFMKPKSQTEDISVTPIVSSTMSEEENVQDEDNFEKRLQFRSKVDYIPVSNRLDYYEINDRILSDWIEVKASLFTKTSDSYLEIDVVEISDILKEIENYVISRYSFPVIDLDESDGIEEEQKSDVDNVEKESKDILDSKDLGDMLFFCPVVFKEHKQLIKGDTKHYVQYKDKTYFFISAKNKNKFKVDPDSYINFKEPLESVDLGPWKICVLTTVCGSGEMFSKKLADFLNVPFINFNFIFERDIVPKGILPIGVLYEDPGTKRDLAFKNKLLLKDLQVLRDYFNKLVPLTDKETMSKLVDNYWTLKHPCTNGFLYYRFPHTLHELKYLVSKMFLPDVIFELKVPEDSFELTFNRIKSNWTAHKGAIKKEIILVDQDTKTKYEEARKRIFRYVLNTVWSREITLREGGIIDINRDNILKRIEGEIEYAKGNTDLLEELMLSYISLEEGEEMVLPENDAYNLYDEIDASNDGTDYTSIKKLSDPLHHTPSIRNIAIRYGLEPKDIDLNVIRRVHKIVCRIVPKPTFKMKTLNQRVNDPKEEVITTHEIELEEISKMKLVANKLKIPWISSYLSKTNLEDCQFHIKEELRLKDPNCLEKVQEVDMKTAEKLLEIGYFYHSKFGHLCPVELYDTKNTAQPFEKRLVKKEIYPLIHRKYIYFIHGEKNRDEFLKHVLKYAQLNDCIETFIFPLKLAVIGPLKSGKTSLAMKLSDLYDLELITPGSAIRYVLRNLSWTMLADHIESCLCKGCSVPDILVARCIEVLTHVGKAPVMGYVLDGVISNDNMVFELAKINIIPHLVIHMTVRREHIFKNLKTSTVPKRMPFSLKYSPHFIDFKLQQSRFPTKQENLTEKIHQHWYNVITVDPITARLSFEQITTEISIVIRAFNENHAKMKNASTEPVKLKHMCISPYEYDTRLHCVIENSCVGCLVEKRQFVSKCLDRPNSLLYKENYFWLCEQHYEPFLNDPNHFMCNLDPKLFQEKARKIVIKGKENCRKSLKIVENKGYCNVCFWDCFPNRIPEVQKGSLNHCVLYREKLFLVCCDQCMASFCLRPEFYHDKKIHCTLPLLSVNQRSHILPRELPLVGYLHTNVADVLQEAVISVGHVRPKYPFMSPELSAALYLGYYLASKRKSTQVTNSFDMQFRQFLARIEIMKQLVDKLPLDYNPFLIGKWMEEGKTNEAFQRKLKTKLRPIMAAIQAMPDECGDDKECKRVPNDPGYISTEHFGDLIFN